MARFLDTSHLCPDKRLKQNPDVDDDLFSCIVLMMVTEMNFAAESVRQVTCYHLLFAFYDK